MTFRAALSVPGWALAALLAAAPAPAAAASTEVTAWATAAASSSIEFTGTLAGGDFTGQFQRFAASIAFDPANLADSRFRVAIETGSANTADTERDTALAGDRLLRDIALAEGDLRGDRSPRPGPVSTRRVAS